MYRYDYVLRLIERLGQVLRTLRDRLLRRQASNDDLRAEIHEIAREAGLDIAFARRLDLSTLTTWLRADPRARSMPTACGLMAELLYVEALAARAAGDEHQARGDLRRALALFGCIDPVEARRRSRIPGRAPNWALSERDMTGGTERGARDPEPPGGASPVRGS
jgi:hypothetical protein